MTEFSLKTDTERRLYVEALFQCLDRALITEHDAVRDLRNLLISVTSLKFSLAEERALVRRITGVLRDYAAGAIDVLTARANFEGLLQAAAHDDVGFFTSARVLSDA